MCIIARSGRYTMFTEANRSLILFSEWTVNSDIIIGIQRDKGNFHAYCTSQIFILCPFIEARFKIFSDNCRSEWSNHLKYRGMFSRKQFFLNLSTRCWCEHSARWHIMPACLARFPICGSSSEECKFRRLIMQWSYDNIVLCFNS